MNHRERVSLDNHIAGGHYRKRAAMVVCRKCREANTVTHWTEFGTGGYDPEECPYCGDPYTEESEWDCEVPDED